LLETANKKTEKNRCYCKRGRVFLTAGAANEKKEKFENEHTKHF
jgi:hypothetical protein